jgi:dephospho-CoA kinase
VNGPEPSRIVIGVGVPIEPDLSLLDVANSAPWTTMSPSPLEISTTLTGRRWKHGSVPVIGLIGGIGSGKSRVAAALAAHGAMVIDADQVGHEVLDQPEVSRAVLERFGERIRASSEDGANGPRINRRALGAIVFADPAALRDLEALLHPRMEHRFHEAIARAAREATAPAIVLDAAILLESGWDRCCDLVVFVEAPWADRLRRVAASRGWSSDTLRAREQAQWPLDVKRARADKILRNDAGIEALDRLVEDLLSFLARPDAAPSAARDPGGPHADRRPALAVPGEAR